MALPEARKFEAYDPALGPLKEMPLLIGITGPSFSGKSYSSETLAAGIKKVYGGEVYHVDTENDRALELHKRYGGPFEFQHVPFRQPKSPGEYEGVIRFCLSKPDCGVIIVDTMTHEHLALLNMMEEYMERKGAGDDWEKRDRLLFASMVQPKAQRKRVNELIAFGCVRPDGRKVPIILLYRAQDKTKPGKSKKDGGDGKPIHKGWQAETTSDLPFYMTARFLLPPGSDGHPNLSPDTEWEKLEIKNPQQFRGWFKPGFQLSEEIGERLARWAKGGAAAAPDEKATILEFIRLKLATIPGTKDRGSAIQRHFLCPSWTPVTKLSLDRLQAGYAGLAAELEGLAAMKAEPPEREPGEDPELFP